MSGPLSGVLSAFFDPNGPNQAFFSRGQLLAIWQHLSPGIRPFAVAMAVAVGATAVAIWLAPRLGMMAVPNRERDIHQRPTPRLGGPALYLAFAVATVSSAGLGLGHLGLLALTGVTAVVMLADDRAGLPAWTKLLFQVAVALVAILALGTYFSISYLTLPGVGEVKFDLWLALPLSLFWLVGMQNTVNLLDGVDGLAAGVVGMVALVLMVAASTRQQTDVVLISAALAGACAGFLFFNFHPARIFMGDSGSQFLGLALGLLSIAGVAKVAVAFALVIPALALAVPIIDTGLAMVRRRRLGQSIAHADSRHIHHQLLDFGLSQPQTCLLFYAATGILGSFGLMLFGHRRALAVAIVLLVVGISTVAGDGLKSSSLRIRFPRRVPSWVGGSRLNSD